MSIKCNACNMENRDEARYCRFCGEEIISLSITNSSGQEEKEISSQILPNENDSINSVSTMESNSKNVIEFSEDGIVGLEKQKSELEKFETQLKIQRGREQNGMPPVMDNKIFVFKGNTGSGKTSLANWFSEKLKKDKLVKGRILTYTAKQLRNQYKDEFEIKKFMGETKPAIILVDAVHEDSEYFHELLLGVSNDKSAAICVFLGLQTELDKFFDDHKSDTQCVDKFVDFENYDDESLLKILFQKLMLSKMKFSADLKKTFQQFISEKKNDKDCYYSNGWIIQNAVIPSILAAQAERLEKMEKIEKDDYITIVESDIPVKSKGQKKEDILADLDRMIGLEDVKKEVRSLLQTIEVQQAREKQGLKGQKPAIHIVFTGNPGTGKTTVARMLGKLFQAIGLLPSANVIETDRSGLVAQYVGQTAPLVNKMCDKAMGGILFIDEAYTLASDSGGFGQEAIDTLLKRMEDDRGKFVVIAAGYEKEMQKFIESNSGLKSRFTHFIHLPDYSPDELLAIYKLNAGKDGYLISESALQKLELGIKSMYENRGKDFANGRTIRNLFDESLRKMGGRVASLPSENRTKIILSTIEAEDIPFEEQKKQQTKDEILAELDAMIGLKEVKDVVNKLITSLQMDEMRKAQGGNTSQKSVHIVFTGNPGTGKTTVARMLGKLFQSIGLLPSANVIETDRSGLVGQYVGQTAPLVNEMCDKAMGGILFIDEAYTLANDIGSGFGQEAIDTLLKRMEDDRGKFVVIAAGYEKEMQKFIESNSGLKSRFTNFIHLADYNPDELFEIFKLNAKKGGYTISEDALPVLKNVINEIYENRGKAFANGRTIRNLFEKTKLNQDTRLSTLGTDELKNHPELLSVIEKEDIPVFSEGGEK